jgi:hypothetical protein
LIALMLNSRRVFCSLLQGGKYSLCSAGGTV